MNGGVIPQPILQDTVRHHFVYPVEELTIIASILARHERDYVYLSARNVDIVEAISQTIHAHRATAYGDNE